MRIRTSHSIYTDVGVAVCLFVLIACSGGLAADTLLFKSGFGPGVTVTEPYISGGRWFQKITGLDSTTGFVWPDDIPGASEPQLIYRVGGDKDVRDYAYTRIDEVLGPYGTMTHALYMEFTQTDKDMSSLSRNEYMLYPGSTFSQLYVKYWAKLQPDYMDVISNSHLGSTHRMFFEVKEPPLPGVGGNRYRWHIHIYRESDTKIYWNMKAEAQRESDLTRYTDWNIANKDVPVPVGEWFLVEIFWKQHFTDGRFLFKVNGLTVGDHRGRLTHPTNPASSLTFCSIFKIYPGQVWFRDDTFKAYQWMTDLELHDSIPTDPPEQDGGTNADAGNDGGTASDGDAGVDTDTVDSGPGEDRGQAVGDEASGSVQGGCRCSAGDGRAGGTWLLLLLVAIFCRSRSPAQRRRRRGSRRATAA